MDEGGFKITSEDISRVNKLNLERYHLTNKINRNHNHIFKIDPRIYSGKYPIPQLDDDDFALESAIEIRVQKVSLITWQRRENVKAVEML